MTPTRTPAEAQFNLAPQSIFTNAHLSKTRAELQKQTKQTVKTKFFSIETEEKRTIYERFLYPFFAS